ncbi:MAG: hypothetical protein NTX25_03755, partial [Proteobacteria bacterium]|nr:hypothetical protein [Pseudomonadota bacterium]
MKRMIGILFLSMLNFTACQQGEESFPASNDTGKIAAPEIASQSPIDSELLKKAFDAAEAAFRKEVELKPSESVYRSLVGLYIEEPSGEVLSSNSNWIYQFVLSSTTDFTKRRNVTMSLKDMKASVTAGPTPLSAYIGEEYI